MVDVITFPKVARKRTQLKGGSALKSDDYLLRREPGWKARLYVEALVENGIATPDELVKAALLISARQHFGRCE